MADRALVVEERDVVARALRAQLEAAGFAVDVAREAQAVAAARRDHALAVLRAEARALGPALKEKHPALQIVVLYADDDSAASAAPDEAAIDGVLVAPLTATAVAATARARARLSAQARRLAELQRAAQPARATVDLHRRLLLMEVRRARRYRYPLSVAVLELDRWTDVAHGLGPEGRVRVLGEILAMLARGLRSVDLPVLHSKERFLIVMPHTPAEGALMVANRLCERIAAFPGPPKLSATAGVGCFEGQGAVSLATLLADAQRGLERAREGAGGAVRGGGARPERKVDFGW